MAIRDNIWRKFGPIIIEAQFDEMLTMINELRSELGKPQIPKEAFLGKIHNNAAHLPAYEWQTESEDFPP